MESTLHVPISEQEHLKDFFTMMNQNGKSEQAEDIEQLLAYMKDLKTGFSDAMEEITYLREQIDAMQNQTIKAKLGKVQEDVQEALAQAQKQVDAAKKEVSKSIRKMVADVKQKGIQALDKVFEVTHVYQGLGRAELFLTKSLETLGSKIDKVGNVADEIHSIKGHAMNAGNAMAGKPAQEIGDRDCSKGILARIEKSMEYCRKMIAGLVIKTVLAKAHMVHFQEITNRERDGAPTPTVQEIAQKMQGAAKMSFSLNDHKLNEAR